MSNTGKIFIPLIVIALILIFCFIFIPSTVEDNIEVDISVDAPEEVSEKIEEDTYFSGLIKETYKAKVKIILANYYRFASDESLDLEQVEKTKSELLSLKVPTEFMDAHLELILALDKMENYFENKDEELKKESLKIIEKIKNENNWLN